MKDSILAFGAVLLLVMFWVVVSMLLEISFDKFWYLLLAAGIQDLALLVIARKS
jgi:hypothetical protein